MMIHIITALSNILMFFRLFYKDNNKIEYVICLKYNKNTIKIKLT